MRPSTRHHKLRFVLAAALAAAPARTAPESNPRLRVKLAAPGGCSIAEPITREVERLLGHTKAASKQLDVDLVVLREQTRLYRLVRSSSVGAWVAMWR